MSTLDLTGRATRTVVAGALLAGVVAIAGCGGGGDKSAPAPPVTQSANPGGVVGEEGTKGLVGPSYRSTSKGSSFTKTAKIPPNSNHKAKGQKGVGGNEACPDAGTTPTSSNLPAINAAILCLVNAERANAGLPKLESNSKLQQAAEGMAARMVSEQFFSHETPDGKGVLDRVEPTGYIPDGADRVLGENLAWGQGAFSTPQAIVDHWMNSSGHKANILATDYKDVGLAAALGAPSPSQSGGTTYVNDFGATLPSESGAESGTGDSATGDPASTASADGDQSTPGTKSTAKNKKKKKVKHKKKRRHKRRH